MHESGGADSRRVATWYGAVIAGACVVGNRMDLSRGTNSPHCRPAGVQDIAAGFPAIYRGQRALAAIDSVNSERGLGKRLNVERTRGAVVQT